MSWDEVGADGAEPGVSSAVTASEHLLLTQVSDDRRERKFSGRERPAMQRLRQPLLTFSYPNGYLNAGDCRGGP